MGYVVAAGTLSSRRGASRADFLDLGIVSTRGIAPQAPSKDSHQGFGFEVKRGGHPCRGQAAYDIAVVPHLLTHNLATAPEMPGFPGMSP
ncbi:hypothetical protein VULLAG_LOCUS10910 [Vulpes lagopus]